jgi:predicted Rossmann fold flavoprotein
MATHKQVVILGAGAAGLMCAIEAGKRGRTVLVLERNDAVGKKIRISGGGRCNFTNLYTTPESFLSENPHFHKSALARYTPADFIALVERHGIRYHEKKLGQLFCAGTSQEIITMLVEECRRARVETRLNCQVSAIRKRKAFELESNLGSISCDSLVIATGGLSIPRLGATAFGHSIARQFGIRVTQLRPGLVPLLLEGWQALSGVSLDAVVRFHKTEFQEKILFTHRGLSGPAILQISSYWKPGEAISIAPMPPLPRRFAQAWNKEDWKPTPAGTEGYAKAEVTVGGIDTAGTLINDDGIPPRSRTLLHRRGRRRHRSPRRIQLSMGLGIGIRGRVSRSNAYSPAESSSAGGSTSA